ncbi:MAG: hypothetical protein NTU83_05745, partial [Candidatus Hydrogenedentes bacterium]|nr:hypothetical protein [Candidatus Hydrogenedentota bacterium]
MAQAIFAGWNSSVFPSRLRMRPSIINSFVSAGVRTELAMCPCWKIFSPIAESSRWGDDSHADKAVKA